MTVGAAESNSADSGLGFEPPGFTVDVRQYDAKDWSLLAALEYTAQRERFTVPKDSQTDFASVPRVFVWFIPTYGKYTKAAILHDDLCRRAEAGHFSRREADGVFRQAMRLQEVPFLRRWVMWTAVRWGSLASKGGSKDWWKDAWRVLPISLLVLPVLLPPALFILAALLVWHLVELVAWVFLESWRRIQTRRNVRPKKVTRPQFSFRT